MRHEKWKNIFHFKYIHNNLFFLNTWNGVVVYLSFFVPSPSLEIFYFVFFWGWIICDLLHFFFLLHRIFFFFVGDKKNFHLILHVNLIICVQLEINIFLNNPIPISSNNSKFSNKLYLFLEQRQHDTFILSSISF